MPSEFQNSLYRMLNRLNDQTGGGGTMLAMAAATYAKNAPVIGGSIAAASEIGELANFLRQWGVDLGEWTEEEGASMGLSHILSRLFNRWAVMAGVRVPESVEDLQAEDDPLAPPFASSNPRGNAAASGVDLSDTPRFAGSGGRDE